MPIYINSGTKRIEIPGEAGRPDLSLGRLGSAFLPSDLSGLVLWLTADADYLYTDTGGTTNVASDGDAVAHWEDRSGNGNHFIQGTGAKQPLYKVNIINGNPVVRFDGTDDLLVLSSNFLSSTEGTVVATLQMTDLANAAPRIFASADEASTTAWWGCHPYRGIAGDDNIEIGQRNNDTADIVAGDTQLVAGTAYVLVWRSDGAAYSMRVDGNDETTLTIYNGGNNGDWLGDTDGRDSFTVGGFKRSSEINFFKGDLRQLLVYNRHLTNSELSQIDA